MPVGRPGDRRTSMTGKTSTPQWLGWTSHTHPPPRGPFMPARHLRTNRVPFKTACTRTRTPRSPPQHSSHHPMPGAAPLTRQRPLSIGCCLLSVCCLLSIGYWLLSLCLFVSCLLAIGYWLLAIVYCLLSIYWLLSIVYCLLSSYGYWLLAIGHTLVAAVLRNHSLPVVVKIPTMPFFPIEAKTHLPLASLLVPPYPPALWDRFCISSAAFPCFSAFIAALPRAAFP
jgi:hypothetical protein